jgi:predicted RNase H-like HicB family nuclease
MSIQWSATDNAYLATFHNLPECKAQGDTYEEAARNGREALETYIEAAKERNEKLPEPTKGIDIEKFKDLDERIARLEQNVILFDDGVARFKYNGFTYEIVLK